MMARRFVLIAILTTAAALCMPAIELNAQSTGNDLALLERPGHHLILRHALAPGTGDPENFKLNVCETQRNLNKQGREQARSIGLDFTAQNIIPTRILSSEWCRTLETARHLDLGPVIPFELLNSVWTTSPQESQRQTAKLRQFLTQVDNEETLLMVTHAVNISALTGASVASGHGLIISVQDGQIEVAGNIQPR